MKLFSKRPKAVGGVIGMYNEQTFYSAFYKDVAQARTEVIIESPFITTRRINRLLPMLRELLRRGVRVYVNTRDPIEHDLEYGAQAVTAVRAMQEAGITVLYTAKHHRKLAIIDRDIVWNGSLNILSQNDSSEIMWRLRSKATAEELLGFINLSTYTEE